MKTFEYYFDYSPEAYNYIMSSKILRNRDKMILKDGTTVELESGASLGNMQVVFPDKTSMVETWDKLTDENLKSVQITDGNDNLIAEYTVNYKKTHSQTLLPMLDEIVQMTDTELESLDVIAVAAGPGSFTGLRIGSATVKGLGLALDKPVIGIPTVEGLAMNLYGAKALICPLMDARRNQVYTGIYRFSGKKLEVVKEQVAVGIEEIIEALNLIGEEVVFLGDGVPVYKSIIDEKISVPYSFAPVHMNKQHASAIAVRALDYWDAGLYGTAAEFEPVYLRLSQAERERLAKEKEKE